MQFGMNVFNFGAKGDGITDDTAAIQEAINYAVKRGGGTILFPYTKEGYRLASPGIEEYEGRLVRSQLVIPPGNHNVRLMGEMPCRLLNTYNILSEERCRAVGIDSTRFGTIRNDNTHIFSTWEAPEIHDPNEKPWSMIAAPDGIMWAGKLSTTQFSIANLEFRVPMNTDKMYPTLTAANLQRISRINIENCQFCLNEQVGDATEKKYLQPNPCHTAGLIASADQNDNNVLHNVAAQGFRYGFVLGEHVVADYLYVHNCEEAIIAHDMSHISMINHVVAQHNQVILSTTRGPLFGMNPGPCYLEVGGIDVEPGLETEYPQVSNIKYGVYDPDGRLYGSLKWCMPPWAGDHPFPTVCSEHFSVKHWYKK